MYIGVKFEECGPSTLVPVPDPQAFKGDGLLFYEAFGCLARVVHGVVSLQLLADLRWALVRVLTIGIYLLLRCQATEVHRSSSDLSRALLVAGRDGRVDRIAGDVERMCSYD